MDELRVINYVFKAVSDEATGFLGQHYFLKVKIGTENKNSEKLIEELNFFAKTAPVSNKQRMQYLTEFGAFKYHDVLPVLMSSISTNIVPNCYFAHEHLIVLENLEALGYKMNAGRDGLLSYEHLKCALKSLAALHASSIIFEQRAGRRLNELCPVALAENNYMPGAPRSHARVQNFYRVMEVLQEMLKAMPQYEINLELILEDLPKKALIIIKNLIIQNINS